MGKGGKGLDAVGQFDGPERPLLRTGGLGATLCSYLLPEPAPERPYVHPTRYQAPANVRVYSDSMDKDYTPSPWTIAFAGLTLGLYVGLPHILLALFILSWWSRTALATLALLLASVLLPARPLRADGVLGSYLFLCWRRYFHFSYLFEQSLDCYKDYIIAQFPHGAFPIGCIVGGTFMATEFPEYHCYALAASSAFLVPVWRHVHAWLGTEVCTKTNFHHLLARGVKGPLHRIHAAGPAAAAVTAAVAAEAKAETEAAAAAVVAMHDAGAAAGTAAEPEATPAAACIAASPFAKAMQPAAAAATGGVAAAVGGPGTPLQQHRSQPVIGAGKSCDLLTQLELGKLEQEQCSISSTAAGQNVHGAHSLNSHELKLLHQRSSLRASLVDSIRSSFQQHHMLSDTESSEESDCDSISHVRLARRGSGLRRLSVGSTSACSCSCRGAEEEEDGASGSPSSSCGGSSICSCCGGERHIPLVTITSSNTMAASRLGKGAAVAVPAGNNNSISISGSGGGDICEQVKAHAHTQKQQHHKQAEAAAVGDATNWIDPATGRRKTGVSVGLMVGGIAEMFMIRRDHERIKLQDRKGFVRIAVEHGTDILPVYMFGTNQVLDFGPPWLQRISRRLRASVGIIYGLWGLPIPRRRPIFMVTGRPLAVGPAMRKDAPGFAARVDELHAAFVTEMERLYYEHRGKYGLGFEQRPLVIC